MGKAPRKCPMCHSVLKWKKIDSTRKGLSFSKAIVGGFVAGPVGAIAGGALGKKKKVYACRKCGFSHEYDK